MDTSKRLADWKEQYFPDLLSSGYGVTSVEDPQYNCIAWAAGEENIDTFWTPFVIGGGYYWPDDKLPRDARVETFVKLYEIEGGFVKCVNNNGDLEDGLEKIALYVDANSQVTHAARQKPDGSWASKLGDWEDIEHRDVQGVGGLNTLYGTVAQFLQRPRGFKKQI